VGLRAIDGDGSDVVEGFAGFGPLRETVDVEDPLKFVKAFEDFREELVRDAPCFGEHGFDVPFPKEVSDGLEEDEVSLFSDTVKEFSVELAEGGGPTGVDELLFEQEVIFEVDFDEVGFVEEHLDVGSSGLSDFVSSVFFVLALGLVQ
jgi:hypothetical protein